ncbi:hypothetical protein [Paracoccus lutimaris]|uniref:Uncharacterized protein n=1 Tax=Paracoccus lutimaris TaxID=1490030 RepID=A0A368YJY9_9RHOB|nr:hypothetical protein [Paracoccus lutimaris]RCW79626.1 hypothetical protein DFP89_12418 [Paracoccus lutimaris]
MFPFSRRLAAGSVLSILMAGTALADTTPALSSLFSPASIAGGLMRGAVSYARMIADIRYGALEVDGLRGGLTMRDLQITGVGKHENCHISLGRLHASGISLWGAENAQMHFDLADLTIATNCFGPNAAMIGMITGGNTIPFDAVSINVAQSSGSGALNADIEAISPGIARIEGSVDFDYVSLFSPDLLEKLAQDQGDDTYDRPPLTFDQDGNLVEPESDPFAPPPASSEPTFGLRGTLRAGHVSVEDLGVWGRVKPLLPPDTTSPQSLQALVTAPPDSKLNEVQRALATVLEGFIARPGRITAEIRPGAPIDFDTTGWTSPEDVLTLFPLSLSNALPTPPVTLIADPGTAKDDRAMGLALAEGRGVPQNTPRAIKLLKPLAEDPEVALALAELIAPTDPAAAYAHAQQAAALAATGAQAALDRIEARMTTSELLAAQLPADSPLVDTAFASVPALRDAALAHEQGKGAPRSYAMAWRLASSAAAAGDGAARALMARLDARFGAEPDWIKARDEAADLALSDWTGFALATRFAAGADL